MKAHAFLLVSLLASGCGAERNAVSKACDHENLEPLSQGEWFVDNANDK